MRTLAEMVPVISLFNIFSLVSAAVLPRAEKVTLAVSPVCGNLNSTDPADFRAGLDDLSSFSTIVTFGDEYTTDKYSNGPTWAEYLAKAAGAELKNYAEFGAFIDHNQWPNLPANTSDLLTQANSFIYTVPRPDASSTLYALFFGIEDYVQSNKNGGTSLSTMAQNIAFTILRLSSSPVFGKNFLVIDNHGRGSETSAGTAFKKELFKFLSSFPVSMELNVAFVDLSTVWNGVLGTNPGPAAFGYTNTGFCLSSLSSNNVECADPDSTFYWYPGIPTTATHNIINEYIQAVWAKCGV